MKTQRTNRLGGVRHAILAEVGVGAIRSGQTEETARMSVSLRQTSMAIGESLAGNQQAA